VNRRVLTLTVGGTALATLLLLGGCERPPVQTTQIGYRGVAMEQVQNPRTLAAKYAANALPAVSPPAPEGGPTAGSVYKNVQVLGDLSAGEFARTMVAITAWVAPPNQSCAYCHGGGDLASDALYTKVVARRMLQMVRDINSTWRVHVGQTGVTCYTCHRGKSVPQYIWFDDPGQPHLSLMSGNRRGKNAPSGTVGLASLPNDPYGHFLENATNPSIRVVSQYPLAESGAGATIRSTENTYGLMMAISQSLGVNCTFCHNSRSFTDWSGSTPQRVTAWYGLQMVRALNVNYLEPLATTLPAYRHGPRGDGPKLDCMTCHQGVNKPLFGQSMLKDYPALSVHTAAMAPAAPAAPATGSQTQ
jgi:photosynthetic reaction center cytochrome c subunit